MVGTQMIAKGHDFPNVTLVGILAADSMINSNDFKSAERTFQLLTQAAGRAGRANKPGRVIIQTYNTEEYSILAACTQNYSGFYSQEIILREKLGYPPFMSIGVITFSGLIDRKVFDAAKWITPQIAGSLNAPGYEFSVLGPSRCPIYKIANRYRWRIIVKSNNQEALIKGLTHIYDNVWSKSKEKDILMSIDINPNNML
jgi:primosomal protein N' (replication factor Y)